MSRLIKSSKFWLVVFGGVVLVVVNAGVSNADAQAFISQVLALYAAIAPVLVALFNALEDVAEKSGSIDVDWLLTALRDLLNEILNPENDNNA